MENPLPKKRVPTTTYLYGAAIVLAIVAAIIIWQTQTADNTNAAPTAPTSQTQKRPTELPNNKADVSEELSDTQQTGPSGSTTDRNSSDHPAPVRLKEGATGQQTL